MSDLYYPPLDETTVKNLEIVRQLSQEHSSYWLTSEYPGSIEKLVKSWFDPKSVKALVNQARQAEDAEKDEGARRGEDRHEYIYQETVDLYRQVKNAKYVGDNEESMTYYKTATTLLEKILALQERSLGMKQVAEHHAAVMRIMENVLTPQQREEFIDQLKQVMGQ